MMTDADGHRASNRQARGRHANGMPLVVRAIKPLSMVKGGSTRRR
jgi:hypothetical protein